MRLALTAALLGASLVAAAPASAQDKKKPWKGGRIKFKREQGSAKDLKTKLEGLLKALQKRAVRKKASQPVKKPGDGKKNGGLTPPPKKKQPASKPAVDKADAPILKTLRSFAPTKLALKDAFRRPGLKTMGKKLLVSARKLFSGDVDAIVARLGIKPELEVVEVHSATTEDLLTMDIDTVAAKHFARALRRTARLLRPRYQWYAVVLKKPRSRKAGAQLQIWFHHKKRYVLLGRIWRLDK